VIISIYEFLEYPEVLEGLPGLVLLSFFFKL